MTASPHCRDCGTCLSESTLDGLCPPCTARIGFAFALQCSQDTPAASVPPLPAQSAGTEFGDYILLQEIARGGMGIVYRARQRSLNRIVAVKMILGGRFASRNQVQRFQQEAEAVANLLHPNIVSIHEIGEVEGQHFFSMDLVEGRNLAELVQDKPLPPDEAAALLQVVSEAVHFAHQHGIIHRDLKPSNILLDHDATPHVTDFGLAKRLAADDSDVPRFELTLTGQVLGSPAFTAPEQAGGRADQVGPASDVYSLGAVLYYAMTGRPPFVADSLERTLAMVLSAPPPSPRLLNPALPRALETISLKCLDKEPARRYQSAREFADDLRRYLRGETIAARPATLIERAWRWAARNRLLAGVVTAAVLILLGGFAGILWQWRRAETHAANEQSERARAESALAGLQLQHAELRLQRGDLAEGLAYLAEILHKDPSNRVAAERLLSVLTHRSFALPASAPFRHPAAVVHAEYSPDGTRVVTASDDGTARVWDTATGEPATPPLRHDNSVLKAHFDAAGERIVTATRNGVARVWNSRTGEPLTPELVHASTVLFAQFHPDAPKLLTGTRDGKATLWDLDTATTCGEPVVHRGELAAAQFSPGGDRFLTVGRFDGHVRISNALTGHSYRSAKVNNNRFEAACFSPDGTLLAAISYQGTAHVWDLASGNAVHTFLVHDTGTHVTFSPDSQLLAAATRAGRAIVWDLNNGEMVREFSAHQTWVEQVQFSADGLLLLTREVGSRAHVWDLLTGKPVIEPLAFRSLLHSVRFAPSGQQVVSATSDGAARCWDVRPGQAGAVLIDHAHQVRTVSAEHDGPHALSASSDGTVSHWNTITGRRLRTHRFSSSAAASFSPDGRHALIGLFNGRVALWDLETGQHRHSYSGGHGHRITHTEFSRDGRLGLSAGFDGATRVWSLPDLTPVGEPLQHEARLWHAAFSPDGSKVATASDDWRDSKGDNTARVWDAQSGQALSPPMRHDAGIYHVVFSPDGSRILTASFDHTAAVWDASSGRRLATMRHESVVRTARFDPRGQRVVSTSFDNRARIWEASTGRPLTPPLRHRAEVHFAGFSPDGTRVVTGASGGALQVWDAATGSPLSEVLPHDQLVSEVHFIPGGRLLAGGGNQARVWSLPDLSMPVPRWLPHLAEVLAGLQVAPDGLVTYDSLRPWSDLHREIARDASPWANWFFADRSTRRISPHLELTLPDLRQRLAAVDSLDGACAAIRLHPATGEPWQRLAKALNRLPEPTLLDSAFAEYASRKSVTLDPGRRDGWLARIEHAKLRNPEETVAVIDAALSHLPGDPELRLLRAGQLAAAERFAEAEGAFAAALAAIPDRHSPSFAKAANGRRDCLVALGEPERAQREWLAAKNIPARPSACPEPCIDLTMHYNAALDEPWHNREWIGNDLAALLRPAVLPTPIPFDFRGLVQVHSSSLAAREPEFPSAVKGIPLLRHARRLHFFHAAAWAHAPKEETTIGSYRIHYSDQSTVEIPLVTNRNIHEWHIEDWSNDDLPDARRIDLGTNDGDARIRLYLFSWQNPHPDKQIASLDLLSSMTQAAPFLVALTAEP